MGFTAYDSNKEWILDPRYGELVINDYFWGEQEDGTYASGRIPKKTTHVCTPEELGMMGDESLSQFMPLRDKDKWLLEMYSKKLLCVDEVDRFAMGDFDTPSANLFNI